MDREVSSLFKTLQRNKLSIAFAESVTCGMASSKLGTCPGTSDAFSGGIVCYSPEVKKKLLGIAKQKIEKYSCESPEITKLLAKNLSKLIRADIHCAITGLAAEGGSESPSKPVGTVFFCVLYRKRFYQERKRFRGSPAEIREKACSFLFQMTRKIIG